MNLVLRCILSRCVLFMALTSSVLSQTIERRTLKVCVAADASQEIREAATRIVAGVSSSPLLSLLAVNGVSLEDSGGLLSGLVGARAYHHLILVGMPSDPLIQAAWQREATVEDGGFYIFGFGHLRGTLGYIESDRNPFLHSAAIFAAPYETEVITITGSSPAGLLLAVDAFLHGGLINGVVAAPGWTRPRATILDRDPLTLPLDKISDAPSIADGTRRVGITQAEESEYRGVLQDTGLMPKSLWRVKYSEPKLWGAAEKEEGSSSVQYRNGLHRRAVGHTLWVAQFANGDDASAAAARIASSAHLVQKGSGWSGTGPSGDTIAESHAVQLPADSPLSLWISGNRILLSTVPQLTPETIDKFKVVP